MSHLMKQLFVNVKKRFVQSLWIIQNTNNNSSRLPYQPSSGYSDESRSGLFMCVAISFGARQKYTTCSEAGVYEHVIWDWTFSSSSAIDQVCKLIQPHSTVSIYPAGYVWHLGATLRAQSQTGSPHTPPSTKMSKKIDSCCAFTHKHSFSSFHVAPNLPVKVGIDQVASSLISLRAKPRAIGFSFTEQTRANMSVLQPLCLRIKCFVRSLSKSSGQDIFWSTAASFGLRNTHCIAHCFICTRES